MVGQKRFSFVAWGLLVGLLSSIGALAADRLLVRPVDKTADPDPIGEPLSVDDVQRLNQLLTAGTGSCQPIGGSSTPANGQFRYRGNVLHIDAADAKLNEFKMALRFTGTISLSFSIHKRDVTVQPEVWKRVFLRTTQASGNGTFQMYSSGAVTLDPPLLQPNTDYAFGVTWGANTVFFVRDSITQPKQLAAGVGQSLGLLSYNGVQPPIDDELPNPAIANVGLFQMEFCFEPVPGACCLASAEACLPLKESDCQSPGSFFHGERTACADVLCAFGACCSPCHNVCKNQYTPGACSAEQGTHHRNASCPTAAGGVAEFCPEVTGACCNGTDCSVSCRNDCTVMGGTYRGDGTICEPNICVGACCIPAFGCAEATQSTCTGLFGGSYRGDGSQCHRLSGEDDPNNPDDPGECGGACCFSGPVSSCTFKSTRRGCTEQPSGIPNAVYLGDALSCGGCPNIQTQTAACCLPDGTCINTYVDFCENVARGTASSIGTQCTEIPIGSRCPTGACCFDDGHCETLTDHGCVEFGGTRHPAAACDQANCLDVIVTGACCKADGCVSQTLEAECVADAGVYKGDDSTCTPELCAGLGSCCTPENTCVEPTTQSFCEDVLVGSFNNGLRCSESEINCERRGACCLSTGGCALLSELDCAAIGGSFKGEDAFCETADICPSGACCLGNGNCGIRGLHACNNPAAGLVYQGTGATCTSGLCTLGACCNADECRGLPGASQVRSQCDAPGEVFGAGQTCAGDTCQIGICCLPSFGGICQDATRLDCTLAGGRYHAGDGCPGGIVANPPCELGACCSLLGQCQNDVFAIECSPTDEFRPGAFCASAPCHARGACCLPGDSQCHILTPAACASAGGTYRGDGQPCDAERCRTGACCLGDGGCEMRHPQQCDTATPGLVYQGDDSTCTSDRCTLGACCDGETCSDGRLPSQCAGPNRSFGPAQTCVNDSCEVGVCCFTSSGGSCQDRTLLDCEREGGRYLADASCPTGEAAEPPCTLGACCSLIGVCQENRFAFECAASGDFTPGGTCENAPCAPRGACCVPDNEQCQIMTPVECATAGGTYSADGTPCSEDSCAVGACCSDEAACQNVSLLACNQAQGEFQGTGTACKSVECPLSCHDTLVSSAPANCDVDPGYPHTPVELPVRPRWDTLDLTFECAARTLAPTDFEVREEPSGGTPRAIISVDPIPGDEDSVRLTFDQYIKLGVWTCVKHLASDAEVCIGFLPGDVNGSGLTNYEDVALLLINLDQPELPIDKCDIDRSGGCYSSDLIEEIDLNNGANPMFNPSTTLPNCPTGPQ